MFKRTTAINKLLKLSKRIKVVPGGTSSGKTFGILPILIDKACKTPGLEISVVSESIPHLRKGALKDFLKILQFTNRYIDDHFNRTLLTYTFSNGSYIEFFSADQEGKVRGPRRNILYINECNNITFETYHQLAIRTSIEIWLDFNPTHEFWVHEELENDIDAEWLILTYKDNEALPESIRKEIEKAKVKAETSDYWKNWWTVYGLGQKGSLQGVVFSDWGQVDSIPINAKLIGYGLDFGFSNDPTALTAIYQSDGSYYWDEIIYQKGLLNNDIVNLFKSNGVNGTIIADSADPKSIAELSSYGYSVYPAQKGPDSIMYGIGLIQQSKFYVTKRSTNIIKELRSYTWDKDREGNTLNKPIDAYNHCFSCDTLISIKGGFKRIDIINVGDLVLTSKGYKKVLKVFNNGMRQTTNYLIHSNEFSVNLRSTPDHRVKTSTGWTEISNLESNQIVYFHKGDGLYKSSTNIQASHLIHVSTHEVNKELVYDLMIEDEHEYFANGILVHNCIDGIRYLYMEINSNKKDFFIL